MKKDINFANLRRHINRAELSALRADFFDRINGIYMISLLFLYPDYPVYPVKKRNFLYHQFREKGAKMLDSEEILTKRNSLCRKVCRS